MKNSWIASQSIKDNSKMKADTISNFNGLASQMRLQSSNIYKTAN